MKKMALSRLLIFGLFFLPGALYAQVDFRPGYVIKRSGDTLHGEINYRGDFFMSGVCKFRDANQQVYEYFPADLIGYRFINGKYYVSKELDGQFVFLEFLIKGELNIYYFRDNYGEYYYLEKEDLQLIEIPYEEEIRYVEDKRVLYSSKKHIGLLGLYMQDAPELLSRIEAIGKPEHKNLINLAEDYHNAVCDDQECVIFKRNIPFFRVHPEIAGGVLRFQNMEELHDRTYVQVGALMHIWMPRANEKLYLKTGVFYTRLYEAGEAYNVVKVPIQFEYLYPRGIFRPRFAYGITLYIPGFYACSLSLGGNIQLTEKLFFSANADFEFSPSKMFLLPKQFISYSPQFGIFMNMN